MGERQMKVAAIETHCRTLTDQDKEGWLSIWADDAVLEDPVGVDTFRGIDTLRTTFWDIVELTSPLRLSLLKDVIVCGNEAIAIISARSSWGGSQREVGPIVDHFSFGPDGKITAMRAHWNFAAVGYRPEMEVPPTARERMVAAIEESYRAEVALDKEAWLGFFAADATVEDPVGVTTIHGIEELAKEFWPNVERARPELHLLDDVIVSGNEAIAILSATIGPDGQRQQLAPIVVHYVFDETGKVRQLRSFFNQ